MSDIATPGLSKAEAMFKDLVWSPMIQGLMAQYGLSWWPMSTIVAIVTDKLFEGLRLSFDLTTIAFLNEEHKKAYANAAVTLKIIGQDKGIDSPEFKAAKEAAKNALSKFVMFGAAA